MSVISRGIEVAPGPYIRGPRMNDAQAKVKFGLHYAHQGANTYFVYKGKYPSWELLGVVMSWPGMRCWLYHPFIVGMKSKIYLAPTRFEAINACHWFINPFSEVK